MIFIFDIYICSSRKVKEIGRTALLKAKELVEQAGGLTQSDVIFYASVTGIYDI